MNTSADLIDFPGFSSSVDMRVPALPPVVDLDQLATLLQTSKQIARRMVDTGLLRRLPLGSPRFRRVAATELLQFFNRFEHDRLARVSTRGL